MPSRNRYLLLPTAGILTFLLLYVLAATLYPGGSYYDKTAPAFSLLHNYWCDLLDPKAHNGRPNPGRPVAIAAMFVLTASLVLLWYWLPALFAKKLPALRYSGLGSAVITTFLFTRWHETVINAAGLLGAVALALTFVELRRAGQLRLLRLGCGCLVLSGVNYFIYETGIGLTILAALQKVTFILFFCWLIWLDIALFQTCRRSPDDRKLQPGAAA